MRCWPLSGIPVSSRLNCTQSAGKTRRLAAVKRKVPRSSSIAKPSKSAAAGKLAESFERLDKMGAVVSCGLGEQADKLADEYRPAGGSKSFRRGGVADLGGSASRQFKGARCA